jgi:rubrerythrin
MKSRFERRIEALERARQLDGRCAACRDWPGQRSFEEYDEGTIVEGWGSKESNPPEQCPSCGFRPLTIVVKLTGLESPMAASGAAGGAL